MKSPVSIALFFLLSGFFLSTLLGAIEHSRRLLGIAAACLVGVACIIVFLTPVQLPSWRLGSSQGDGESTAGTTAGTTVSTTVGPAVGTTVGPTTASSVTTGALGARSR